MKTEQIPTAGIVYTRRVGEYGQENIRIMEQMKQWAGERGLMNDDAVVYAIAWDDPSVTESTECRYDVCLLTEHDPFEETEDIKTGKLMGGLYAVLETEHTPKGMQDAWDDVFGMIRSGRMTMDASRPIMERYAAEMVRNHRCELCVPIVSS